MEEYDISEGLRSFLLRHNAYASPESLVYWRKVYRRQYNRNSKRTERRRKVQVTLMLPSPTVALLKAKALEYCLPLASYITEAAVGHANNARVRVNNVEAKEVLQVLRQIASDIRYIATREQPPYSLQLQALALKVDEMEDATGEYFKRND